MTRNIRELVPKFSAGAAVRTPATVLKEFGDALSENTNYRIKGKVVTTSIGTGDMVHIFAVNVPAMDFLYEVFAASHSPVELYPLKLYGNLLRQEVSVASEEELVQQVGAVFQSDAFKNLISSLLAQSATSM